MEHNLLKDIDIRRCKIYFHFSAMLLYFPEDFRLPFLRISFFLILCQRAHQSQHEDCQACNELHAQDGNFEMTR